MYTKKAHKIFIEIVCWLGSYIQKEYRSKETACSCNDDICIIFLKV